MKSFVVRATLAILYAAAIALPTLAQENINSASVSGRVTDPSGDVVAGAQVTARQTDTNLTRSTNRPGRTLPLCIPQSRTLRNQGSGERVRGGHPIVDLDRGCGV